MNQLLTVAFIPFFICCAFRAYLVKTTGVDLVDVRTFSNAEIWIYLISLLLACLSFWHCFVRAKCPYCKSYAVRHIGTEEVNQYHAVRKVRERDNQGRLVTRHLNVTVAEKREYFECECGREWFIEVKEDKK